jgi:ELWxxDGT repeat protein
VFFRVRGDERHDLWSSDGTPAGTGLLGSFTVGARRGVGVLGGRRELWRSDGSAAGTALVQDIAPGAASSSPQALAAIGARLYFSADDGRHGAEPWSLPLP